MTARIRSRQIARLVWAAALCTVVASARGQAVATVTFSQSPWAIKAGDNVGITFAVSAPTDVEVAILAGVALVGPDEMQGRPGQLQGARVHRGAPRRQPSRPGPGRSGIRGMPVVYAPACLPDHVDAAGAGHQRMRAARRADGAAAAQRQRAAPVARQRRRRGCWLVGRLRHSLPRHEGVLTSLAGACMPRTDLLGPITTQSRKY